MLVTAREVEVELVIVPFVANKLPAVSAVLDAYGKMEFCVVEVDITKPTVGEEDALIFRVAPRATDEPPEARPEYVRLIDEFARSVFCTVAQVAVPAPLSDRTNWLVQLDPVYAVAVPFAEPKKSAFGIDETVRLLVEAVVNDEKSVEDE